MNDTLDIAAIEARHDAATPGPYMWDLRTATQLCQLVTTHSGQYYVMGFERWGFHNAIPSFQVYEKYEGPLSDRHGRGLVRADKMAKSYPGKEHHEGFDDFINHPDAVAFAKSWEDVDALLDEIKRLTAENERLRDAKEIIEDMANQFSYQIMYKGRAALSSGGLSALESAFSYLGWDDPKLVPENECQIDGCHKHATCGTPTPDGYKHVCGEHFRKLTKEE